MLGMQIARNFMLIMTDAMDDNVTELINPIDTFPRKHKLQADYAHRQNEPGFHSRWTGEMEQAYLFYSF